MPRSLRLVAVLYNIRSLYNVGSMLRTAEACAIEHVYLCGLTGNLVDPLTKQRIGKTALGAEELVPWTYSDDVLTAIDLLKRDGFTILALEQTSEARDLFAIPNSHFEIPQRLALLVGHELYGISERALAAADDHVQIPMLGQKESLNVAVAFGIAVSCLRWGQR